MYTNSPWRAAERFGHFSQLNYDLHSLGESESEREARGDSGLPDPCPGAVRGRGQHAQPPDAT
jgi:hypothetical protein